MIDKYFFMATVILFCLCFLWIIIDFKKHKIFMLFLIPAFLWMASYTYITIESFQGYPTVQKTTETFTLHWYLVKEKKFILLWVTNKHGKAPRVHQVPYSRELHEKLHGLKKQLGDGKVPVQGKRFFGPKIKKDDYRFYNFKYKKHFPKG